MPPAVRRRLVRVVAGSALTVGLKARPRRVTAVELDIALGGAPLGTLLREDVLGVLPTVRDWAQRLDVVTPAGSHEVICRADAAADHVFDLLGSGPTWLGAQIDWHTDFKTGRRWPLRHPHLLPTAYGDGSDIKVPWELSRGQHLPLLAAAHQVTGDPRYVAEMRDQLAAWRSANPVGLGVNWKCTMDVAIRAANWLAAIALLARNGVDEPWMRDVGASLLLHARFIRTHLEDTPVRGNHYLADVVGLAVVAALFGRSAEGRKLADWATAETLDELEMQVRDDGVVHEASISYHRLVTEMFVCGVHAADALFPGRVTPAHRERLARALRFTADYIRPDGLAPQVGDGDDGRFLPLDDQGEDPRDHRHLFAQSGRPNPPPADDAAYPSGGFFVARRGGTFLLVRCGDTGMAGTGTHAHNDQLSFELAAGGQPLIVDPGTFVYTASAQWRNRFRSTAAHTTLRVDSREQNTMASNLFSLPDRSRAELLEWSAGTDGVRFAGRHKGFAPTVHTRTLTLTADGSQLRMNDVVDSHGFHMLDWTFTVAPGLMTIGEGKVSIEYETLRLEIMCAAVSFSLIDGWLSRGYGMKEAACFVAARKSMRERRDETTFVMTISD